MAWISSPYMHSREPQKTWRGGVSHWMGPRPGEGLRLGTPRMPTGQQSGDAEAQLTMGVILVGHISYLHPSTPVHTCAHRPTPVYTCPNLSASDHTCSFLSVLAHTHPHLPYDMPVHTCPYLSILAHTCPYLPRSTPSTPTHVLLGSPGSCSGISPSRRGLPGALFLLLYLITSRSFLPFFIPS